MLATAQSVSPLGEELEMRDEAMKLDEGGLYPLPRQKRLPFEYDYVTMDPCLQSHGCARARPELVPFTAVERITLNTMDADVMAAMGISGFGKQPRKRQLDVTRFDKAKREEVCPI